MAALVDDMGDVAMSDEEEAVGSSWEFINAEDVMDYVQRHGVEQINNVLCLNLDQWKTIPLRVAITGESGSGKSSFINAIRGLTADDDDAAEVNVKETTTEPMSYTRHPDNGKLQFWDLPGVGTPNFPRESYLEKVEFKTYDFFMIFSHARFTENDLWLAKEVDKKEKKFVFVRTKIDDAINAERRARPRTFNEAGVPKTIKDNVEENFTTAGLTKYSIFLISNFETEKWDFPALTKHLIDELPALKREAMILSLGSMTGDIIREKKRVLQGRIWKVAAASAAGAAIPITELSRAVDIVLLSLEVNFYEEQLGLDERSLRTVAEATGQTMSDLQQAIGYTVQSTEMWITTMPGMVGGEMAGEEVSRFIPYIGSAIAASISFVTTYRMLNKALNDMEVAALKVLEITVQKNVQESRIE